MRVRSHSYGGECKIDFIEWTGFTMVTILKTTTMCSMGKNIKGKPTFEGKSCPEAMFLLLLVLLSIKTKVILDCNDGG